MLALPIREEISLVQGDLHQPALLGEILEALAPRRGAVMVDATLGTGGHAEALLEELGPDGRLVGIDRDPQALRIATERLARFGEAFLPVRSKHEELLAVLHGNRIFAVDGILFDLGVSSLQLDDAARGFSFRADGPLDMRMGPDAERSAAELLAEASERELREILATYGEERKAGAIARAVVRERAKRPLTRTGELAELVESVLGGRARRYRIHPATRTFQALRIYVNREVVGLQRLITDAVSVLRRGGRLAVIAYHSLEDRAVKHALRSLAQRCSCPPGLPVCGCGKENLVRVMTTKPRRPSTNEVARNPRSRSARLRVAERL